MKRRKEKPQELIEFQAELIEFQKRLDAMTERNRQPVAGGALQRRRQAELDLNEALDLLEGVNRTGAFDRFLESHNRVVITSDDA